ncbi:MAG: tetratricopeptide repeat protein [Candidatus Omnitrophota bacterium]
MNKVISVLLAVSILGVVAPLAIAEEYDFGDMKSVTLASKAWQSLGSEDIEAVLAYTNKCIELYGEEAEKMQASLDDFPAGSNQEIFSYWALNDVGTCLYIQGEAYLKADMLEEAKDAFNILINQYSYAQCWDPKGWFWKPAEAAREKLRGLLEGKIYDFGDYRSVTLTGKAWQALAVNELDAVLVYTNKCIELYKDDAKKMQTSLKEYPWETKEHIFSFWALNDVGTCLFIKGDMLMKAGKTQEAKEVFITLIRNYPYSQCWDPKGWFWKPADAAKEKLAEMQ